jgi:hypothetical protein
LGYAGLALLVWEKELLGKNGLWNFDHTEGIKDYPNEVLFVGSSHSPIGYQFQRDFNSKVFPHSRLLNIEQSGHRIITEQWDALEAGLRDYLHQY